MTNWWPLAVLELVTSTSTSTTIVSTLIFFKAENHKDLCGEKCWEIHRSREVPVVLNQCVVVFDAFWPKVPSVHPWASRE